MTTFLSVSHATDVGNYSSHSVDGRKLNIMSSNGESIRLTAYGDQMLRIQAVPVDLYVSDEDRHIAVVKHDWPGSITATDKGAEIEAISGSIKIVIKKTPLRIAFYDKVSNTLLCQESKGLQWGALPEGSGVAARLQFETGEKFYGSINDTRMEYSGTSKTSEIESAALGWIHSTFFVSSKKYGLFVNTPNRCVMNFTSNNGGLFIKSHHEMDYFIIKGSHYREVLANYHLLTGKPQLPPLSAFGLWLSDKAYAQTSATWWLGLIDSMRLKQFPFDVIHNDNHWRAGKCGTIFEYSPTNYPNPRAFSDSIVKRGVSTMIDWNACICPNLPGWNASFALGGSGHFPDFSKPEVRDWSAGRLWNLFDPTKKLPADMIWLDEFEPGTPDSLANSYDLLQVSAIRKLWDDKNLGDTKRLHVLIRGLPAGGHRLGNVWSGDITSDFPSMKAQIPHAIGSGFGGFPYFAHDGGGFTCRQDFVGQCYDHGGLGDTLYIRWAMAYSSFTPIWRPHGPRSRVPWHDRRSEELQAKSRVYAQLRMKMLPYIYSNAFAAHDKGELMVRPMFWDYPSLTNAATMTTQYMWGPHLLVAPTASITDDPISVSLPQGNWYNFWTDAKTTVTAATGQTITHNDEKGAKMGVFVKAGAVIPMAPYAISTKFMRRDSLTIHVYAGADGEFTLYEDDGITEKFLKGERRTTLMKYTDNVQELKIDPAVGTLPSGVTQRAYRIIVHGLSNEQEFKLNNVAIQTFATEAQAIAAGVGKYWDNTTKTQQIIIPFQPVSSTVRVHVGAPTSVNTRLNSNVSFAMNIVKNQKGYILKVNGIADGKLTIIDFSGKTIASYGLTSTNREISLNSEKLSLKSYIVKVTSLDGFQRSQIITLF